ncbi:MAG: agmatinase [Vampirovibrionales bacterium]
MFATTLPTPTETMVPLFSHQGMTLNPVHVDVPAQYLLADTLEAQSVHAELSPHTQAPLPKTSGFWKVQRPVWMASESSWDTARWVMVGVPYDGTCSYRPGSRFAPSAIREASWGIECYSPHTRTSLEEAHFYDAGEMELPMGNRDLSLARIKALTQETLAMGKQWFGVGGEHLITLPSVEAYLEQYPDLAVLHFDAHGDLAQDLFGEKLSHGSVIRRIADVMEAQNTENHPALRPEARIVQVGIRAGTPDQFDWMSQAHADNHVWSLETTSPERLAHVMQKLEGRPVFVTFDVDCLDPSVMPGTGTPEPPGLTFQQVLAWFKVFSHLRVVGMDLVELAPHYDASGASTVASAKLMREMLCSFGIQA